MLYKEVIRPPLWLLAFIYFLFLSVVVAVWAAFDLRATYVVLTFLTFALIVIALKTKTHIELSATELKVGRAHIELKYIASVEALSADQTRILRTRDADPAAYLGIKFWISTGVKMTLRDTRDSTPYWLISTKRPEELTRTLYKLL
jgi:hypothetical protein